MRNIEFVKAQIALLAWREAHHLGGYQGMRQVAQIIMNRVRNGWGTAMEMIEKQPQFSAYNLEDQRLGYPDPREPSFARLLGELDAIYDGSIEDTTNSALFWGDITGITREWFKVNVMDHADHPRKGNNATLAFWG